MVGLPVSERLELSHTLEGITHRSQQLLVMMDRWRDGQPALGVWLSFPDQEGRRGGYCPRTQQLPP